MIDVENFFSVQIFVVIFRETLETAIIISVLLSFISQRTELQENGVTTEESSEYQQQREINKKLKLQVWVGAIIGLSICVVIGIVFILCFYLIGKDFWSYTERIWEGLFSILSSIIITMMGIGLLRINKIMKVHWWIKLGDAYHERKHLTFDAAEDEGSEEEVVPEQEASGLRYRFKKYVKAHFLSILPLVTTLREGLEAVVFVGGIGATLPLSSLPVSIILGVLLGALVGYLLFRGGNKLSLQYFLICLTCFLYIVSAGLLSRGVWFLELERYVRLCGGLDVSETGSGPGSYDVSTSVWHVNCCNGLTDGWYMVLNALVGWTNSATYGSVISYCIYWIAVIVWLEVKLYEESHGVLPLIPVKWQLKLLKKKALLIRTRVMQERQQVVNHEQDESIEDMRPSNGVPDESSVENLREPESVRLLSK